MEVWKTGETCDAWLTLPHKTIFLSCSSDMAHAVATVEALVERLNARVPRGDRWKLYHWSKSDDPWPAGRTWQERIPRPSDPKVDVVICLLGERLGEPLPDYFPLPSDLPLPAWVNHPWLSDRTTGVPLTGTLFELLDALAGPSKERLRDRTLTYVKVDARLFTKPGLAPDERVYGFEQHYDKLRGSAKRIRNVEDDVRYRTQIAWLDSFCDEFFRKLSRPAICYGKEGQTLDESLQALRARLLPDLEKLFGLRRRSGLVELKGLTAYQPDDADILFGRDRAIERILERLATLAPPMAALTGRSGEGKSSVLRAGLIGRLKRAQYPQYGRFRPVLFDAFALAGKEPFETLAAEVDRHLPEPLWGGDHKVDDFSPGERVHKFVEAVRESLAAAPQTPGQALHLFVAIDQFEELLVPATEDAALAAGLHELLAAMQALASQGLAWVVMTLPAEHMQRLKVFAPDQPIDDIQLPEVGEEDIRDIVTKSLEAAGIRRGTERSTEIDGLRTFSRTPELGASVSLAGADSDVAKMIDDIVAQAVDWLRKADNPGPVLPLLSLLLTDLVAERRKAPTTKLVTTDDAPAQAETEINLAGVLGRLGERAWAEAEKVQLINLDKALSRLLRHFATTGTSDGGRLKLLRNCAADHPAALNASALVQALRKVRLVYSPAPDQLRLTHVAVIDHWQRATEWYEEDQKHHLTLTSLTERADAWSKARASGRNARLITEAEDLDALQDLWSEWYDDRDRLPLDFMRESVKAAFDPVAQPESWKMRDGTSRFSAIVGSNDDELLAHATSMLERLPTEKQQEIINSSSPKSRSTALMAAARLGNKRYTRWLIKAGADVYARSEQQLTPLHFAAFYGHEAAARALLAAGADVNARIDQQFTPLHFAAVYGHEAAARALLAAGADVNARNEQQFTPLHAAAQGAHEAVAQALLAAGADVNARADEQWTPLALAASNGHEAAVRALIAAGADVNARSYWQATPLHWAAVNGHEAAARALLAAGADVNACANQQFTPLHAAAQGGHEAVAQALLAAGADVNAHADRQATPLTVALALHRLPIVSLLIAAGGDLAFAWQCQAAWFADPDLSIDNIVERTDMDLTEDAFAVLRERIKTAGVKDFDGFVAFLEREAAALGGNAAAAIAKLKAGAASGGADATQAIAEDRAPS